MRRNSREPQTRRPRLRHGVRISFRGVLFLVSSILMVMIAMDSEANLLMLVFGLCFGAFFLNMTSGWWALRSLRIRRELPEMPVAGQPCVARYSLTNTSRWSWARSIRLADTPLEKDHISPIETFVSTLAPGETITINVPTLPLRRGRLHFSEIRLSSRHPFGIVTKSVTTKTEAETIIFPTLARLKTEIKLDTRAMEGTAGDNSLAFARGDDEFYGIREYRIGDNPRRIHWRRSARTGQLMIREMTKTHDPQLWCVVNTQIESKNLEQAENLETIISCAATIICDALERGSKVGLICNGEPLLVLPPAGGRSHRPRLLRELALRTANLDCSLVQQIQRLSWPGRWRGACMVFGVVESDDLRDAVRTLEQAIGRTTVYVPGTLAFEQDFHVPDVTHTSTDNATTGNAVAGNDDPRKDKAATRRKAG